MSLSQRRESRRARIESRAARRSAHEQQDQLVLLALGLLGGIAVTLFTEGPAALGIGALFSLVCAVLFLRQALRLWREHRSPTGGPVGAKSYEEELRERIRSGPL